MASQRIMTRSESRLMYARITAAREANAEARKVAAEHRLSCPLELAKTLLRRRGWHVFDHSVLVRGSNLVVVGKKPMSRETVIQMAARIEAGS